MKASNCDLILSLQRILIAILDPVQTWCPGTEMDVVQTRQCPELKMFIKKKKKQLGKGIDYREIGAKFWVDASTACKKVNASGTDENLFRLVPARCPSTTSGASGRTRARCPNLCLGTNKR